MKPTIVTVGLLCLYATVAVCGNESQNTYSISGTYVPFGLENADRAKDSSADDLDSSTILVTYDRINDTGESERIALASGSFIDGAFRFEGEIDAPTEVEITVQAGNHEKLTTNALISPYGEEVTFAYVVHYGVVADTTNLYLLGNARRSKDQTTKFTVSGDLSGLEEKLPFATIEVWWREWVAGELETRRLGTVMAEDDVFLLEADIEEPTVATVFVSGVPEVYFLSFIDVVIEPEAAIEIHANNSAKDLVATADRGSHDRLIDSWSQSTKYSAKSKAYDIAYAEYQDRRIADMRAERSELQDAETGDSSKTMDASTKTDSEESEGVQEDDGEQPASQESVPETLASGPSFAEGCEHVPLYDGQSAPDEAIGMVDEEQHEVLQRDLDGIREAALQDIAKYADNPMDSLLAMELKAFSTGSHNRTEAFPVYDRLAKVLDEDLVDRRVTPRRERLIRSIAKDKNDKKLVIGQKVPGFVLSTVSGDEISLANVLDANEFVLVDFWASWCAPCIRDFPSLKEMHADHNENGFEIIAISIDSTFEEWEEGSNEHELPWVSVGEIEGFDGPIASAYGVAFIPKKFLLDSHGCILKKDPEVAELREFLNSQYEELSN